VHFQASVSAVKTACSFASSDCSRGESRHATSAIVEPLSELLEDMTNQGRHTLESVGRAAATVHFSGKLFAP